jgi:hypothetical protein
VKIGFKIQRISDGRYSTGGWEPTFTRIKGKEWSTVPALRSHLTRIQTWADEVAKRGQGHPEAPGREEHAEKLRNVYRDCRILKVTYVATEAHQPLLDNLLKR